MKISCTQEEKDIFIRALTQNEVCLYTDTSRNLECDWNCQDCYEKSIKWVITDQEWKKHKCKECKHLAGKKHRYGIECVCPGKKFVRSLAKIKYPHGKACTHFEPKEINHDSSSSLPE